MLHAQAFAATLIASTIAINNAIFVISKAEQLSPFLPGLSAVGFQRANECLPQLFADKDIGKIIMCPKNEDSAVDFETLATTQRLADSLCGADENTDDDCVTDLTVWDFFEVGALLEEDLDLDTDPAGAVDGIHYDVVVEVVWSKIRLVTSQNCTDIDGEQANTARRRALSDSERRGRSYRRREGKRSRRNARTARST